MRVVKKATWKVSSALSDNRVDRLLNPLEPYALIDLLQRDARGAIFEVSSSLTWQPAEECPGYFRVVAQVPVSELVFDMFFNGRSGYRAQYYLSPEEGILFNHKALDALAPVIRDAYHSSSVNTELHLIERSLRYPHAKIWIADEQRAFDEAIDLGLDPPRWRLNGRNRGRKAPLSDHLKLDIKGSFIDPHSSDLFVDELKIDRAWDLYNHGYT